MLPHGWVWPVSVRSLQGLPAVHDIDVGLSHLLL
jgi:hypothetical protein